jgi:hypothetical protein
MGKNHRIPSARFPQLHAISREASQQIGRSYGTGHLSSGTNNNGLPYHNLGHTQRVRLGTAAMAAAFDLAAEARAVADVAASAHDVIQLKPRGVMEQESASWLEQRLYKCATPVKAVETGVLAVLGTEPILEAGMITGQVVSRLSYPSKEAAKIALSVACADLGELHARSGPLASHKIYQELQGGASQASPDWEKLLKYQVGQAELVEDYRYPHTLGHTVLGTLKSEVVAYTSKVLTQLERGALDGWQQLIDQDVAFMYS